MKTRQGRGSRGKLIKHSDDYIEQMEQYISETEAAALLSLSVPSVKAYKYNGRLPSEVAPSGQRMLLRAGVIAYSQAFYPEDKLPYANCDDCGKPFERKRLASGRAADKENKFYRDGKLCPDCRKAAKNGGVDVKQATSSYVPHSGGQVEFHESKARYKLLSCGNRWGKDRCSINEFIQKFAQMLSEDRGPEMIPKVHGFLVAPNFGLTRQLWRELKEFMPADWIEQIWEGDKIISTKGGGLIEIKSADDPNALVSVGLDIILVTEAARIANLDEVWSYLYGRVQSPGRGPNGTGGIILMNSTPKGRNYWGGDLIWRGIKTHGSYDPDFETFIHPAGDNPYIRPEEIEKARKNLPDRLFRQEWMAEVLDEADSVFRNVKECANYMGPEEPEAGEQYVIGWDPAMVADYSAVAVRNSSGQVVTLRRWTGVPWEQQVNNIVQLSHYYNYAPVVVDVTGIGKTLPQTLERKGITVGEDNMVHFTNQVKEDLVNNLAFLMEQKQVAYPAEHEHTPALMNELTNFKYFINEKTGTVRYSAPRGNGQFDDLVTAVMLSMKDFTNVAMELPYYGIFGGVQIGGGKRNAMAN